LGVSVLEKEHATVSDLAPRRAAKLEGVPFAVEAFLLEDDRCSDRFSKQLLIDSDSHLAKSSFARAVVGVANDASGSR